MVGEGGEGLTSVPVLGLKDDQESTFRREGGIPLANRIGDCSTFAKSTFSENLGTPHRASPVFALFKSSF